MSNVVQLDPPQPGQPSFFLCGCDPKDPHAFLPICLHQQPPVIVGLLCPQCDQHLTIVNGVIQPPQQQPT